ncbi:MAG TPA: Uma2 family endonuclease [Anaerolineae bacterium]
MTVKMPTNPPSTEQTARLTGEELLALGDVGPVELIKGELVDVTPAGHPHSYYEGNVYVALRKFVREHKLGRVLVGEVGIYTRRNPDTVRGADVAYISNERLDQVESQSYLDVAPELIVEILSPHERWVEVMEKLDEYFAIDVLMVWVVDPQRQQIYVYHSPTDVERFTAKEAISGGEVLSGLKIVVAELFE